mmetsp:Transcript_3114/g.4190  ORF Transcript_3114/g.4190 Transcript_3114/m.4190 type:complete len:496 (-) Transcript_3114:51-1538(-)|eukprot:CAMPEP_0196588130 /NCGR_PEP_ID=MMETSP1081-20130531/59655_1 /TAXON_ID=36882 /ORGANISM="Pyramimonas amylifera, Strain CCMP720" /LENGTH=495 /DNA_ID=CAMNT_0041910541 /DNA_START=1 /DNA_END=1488 /DNA_ORIENTATION=-
MDTLCSLHKVYWVFQAANCGMLVTRLMLMARGNKRLAFVTDALGLATWDLIHFFVVFGVVQAEFSCSGMVLFGDQHEEFSSLLNAFHTTSYLGIIGDYSGMKPVAQHGGLLITLHQRLARVLFCSSLVLVDFFLLLNFVLAIMENAFLQVKDANQGSPTILQDLMEINKWFVLGTPLGWIASAQKCKQILAPLAKRHLLKPQESLDLKGLGNVVDLMSQGRSAKSFFTASLKHADFHAIADMSSRRNLNSLDSTLLLDDNQTFAVEEVEDEAEAEREAQRKLLKKLLEALDKRGTQVRQLSLNANGRMRRKSITEFVMPTYAQEQVEKQRVSQVETKEALHKQLFWMFRLHLASQEHSARLALCQLEYKRLQFWSRPSLRLLLREIKAQVGLIGKETRKIGSHQIAMLSRLQELLNSHDTTSSLLENPNRKMRKVFGKMPISTEHLQAHPNKELNQVKYQNFVAFNEETSSPKMNEAKAEIIKRRGSDSLFSDAL